MFDRYTEGSTGGGFVAYFREIDGVQVMVTCSADETRLPTDKDLVDVAFYNRDGGEEIQLEASDAGVGLTVDEAERHVSAFLEGRGKAK